MSDSKEGANQRSVGVPAAIVIAGGLIALAVYVGGRQAPAQVADVQPEGTPQVAAGQAEGPTVGDIRPVGEDDHVRGAVNAKVTIIEYSDTECPFCKRFHETMKQVVAEYPNDVRWVYRHFPLDQLHSQARKEAVAVECAGEQGKAWEMLDKIYEVTPSNDGLDLAKLPQYARESGVSNISAFESCLESGKYDERVAADLADAQKAGGRGTPYSVIIDAEGNKTPLSGAQPLEAIKAAIEEAL